MTKLQKAILIITALALLLFIGIIFAYVSRTELSSQANTLLSVLLTLLSFFISTIVAHFYFESSKANSIRQIKHEFQDANKLYAQKAAEKVANLSGELTKLSLFLQQEQDEDLEADVKLLISQEKNAGAVHIIETLKSINDRSLSDWKGVVPEEELEDQNEAREEREMEFLQVLKQYRDFLDAESSPTTVTGEGQPHTIQDELSELNKKIDTLATTVIGTPLKKSAPVEKIKVSKNCPACSYELTFRQKPNENSRKNVACPNCGRKLQSSWSQEDGFILEIKRKPGPSTFPPKQIEEDTIQKVKDRLPSQPWPTGTSSSIASELGLTGADMKRAVRELIARGDFKPQVDGVVYESQEEANSARQDALSEIE